LGKFQKKYHNFSRKKASHLSFFHHSSVHLSKLPKYFLIISQIILNEELFENTKLELYDFLMQNLFFFIFKWGMNYFELSRPKKRSGLQAKTNQPLDALFMR